MRTPITSTRLREIVSYNPETGVFTRLINSARGKGRAGDKPGYIESTGYSAFCADGRKYLAHRLAWLYMTGSWPASQLDHINGDRTDNRFANLREVSNGENQQNLRVAKKHNKCGMLGVSRNKKRWKAEIRFDGQRKHIGTYDTPEEAHIAYLSVKRKVHIEGVI